MRRYYFDYNATTPPDPAVVEAMIAALREAWGNASSIHAFGQQARALVEAARRSVAELLHCDPAEIVFTSGGTEANNLAIIGTVRESKRTRPHVITTAIEHPAVLNTCCWLETQGVEVTYVPVGRSGVVDPGEVRRALRPETVLITVMHANNEIGTLQPVAEIAAIAREAGVRLHTDAVQSTGKVAVHAGALGVDLLSLSAHKFYGPKGVGALYIRKGVAVEPVQHGGRHERGRRPGTENVPAIAGLGKAAGIAAASLAQEGERQAALRAHLEQALLGQVAGSFVNGAGSPRTPNTANICFEHIDGEPLLIALDLKGIAVSSGAACSSGASRPSHVLTAIGLTAAQARSCLRFSIGKGTAAEDVDVVIEAAAEAVERLRKLSPESAPAPPRHAAPLPG